METLDVMIIPSKLGDKIFYSTIIIVFISKLNLDVFVVITLY
jgi:hypothetical protein